MESISYTTTTTTANFCSICKYRKPEVYTSNPPKYWCTKHQTYVNGDHSCDQFELEYTTVMANAPLMLDPIEYKIEFTCLDDVMQAARAMIHSGHNVRVYPVDSFILQDDKDRHYWLSYEY